MSDELVFYTHPMSRGRMVRWMLEEIGQPYRTEVVDYGPPMKTPPYRAVNPMGKVPAIRRGDVVVTETGAICAWLAEAFPQAELAPPIGCDLRGAYYRWMFFAAGPLEAAISNKACAFEVPTDKQGMMGYGTLALVTDTLDEWLRDREYFLGKKFSAADVYAGSQIAWTMHFGMLERRPSFEQYVERIRNRPAAVRAREIDDALLAQHPPRTAAA